MSVVTFTARCELCGWIGTRKPLSLAEEEAYVELVAEWLDHVEAHHPDADAPDLGGQN